MKWGRQSMKCIENTDTYMGAFFFAVQVFSSSHLPFLSLSLSFPSPLPSLSLSPLSSLLSPLPSISFFIQQREGVFLRYLRICVTVLTQPTITSELTTRWTPLSLRYHALRLRYVCVSDFATESADVWAVPPQFQLCGDWREVAPTVMTTPDYSAANHHPPGNTPVPFSILTTDPLRSLSNRC